MAKEKAKSKEKMICEDCGSVMNLFDPDPLACPVCVMKKQRGFYMKDEEKNSWWCIHCTNPITPSPGKSPMVCDSCCLKGVEELRHRYNQEKLEQYRRESQRDSKIFDRLNDMQDKISSLSTLMVITLIVFGVLCCLASR